MACGGGSSAPAQPSTTTSVQDIPAWEQGYVTSLLGQAQTEAAQPYQQFPGQQVAGFTPDQTQAFSNIENAGTPIAANQTAASGQVSAGANSANNIYGAGSNDINASTMAASPQGIQAYQSPYNNSVVQGIQNEADLNWNQNIMPGVNNEFVGSGQFGSGRNAQVLGQAAGNFQTGLSSNVANALESGYTTAGQEAATEAGLLGSAGTSLGNLASTQAGQQLNAGSTLGSLGAQQAATNLTQNQALQAVGQEQQGQNQTNLNVAQTNFQNQVQYPEQQTQFLNQIVRGLPTPTASTSAGQVATPSVSPLSSIGAGTVALAGLNTPAAKEGGLIKGYASGGQVDDSYGGDDEDMNPLEYSYMASQDSDLPNVNPLAASTPTPIPTASTNPLTDLLGTDDGGASYAANGGNLSGKNATPVSVPLDYASDLADKYPNAYGAAPSDDSDEDVATNPLEKVNKASQVPTVTPQQQQQSELLALARGMLTPQVGGSVAGGVAAGLGNVADLQKQYNQMNMQQNALNYQRDTEAKKLGIEQQSANQRGQYYKDIAGARNDSNDIRQQLADIKAKGGGSTGQTQQMMQAYAEAHGLDLTDPDDYDNALAHVKATGNADKLNVQKENLALRAVTAGQYKDLPTARAAYGLAPTANVPTATLSAPPALSDRVEGKSYPTPKGLMVWSKDGWISSNAGS